MTNNVYYYLLGLHIIICIIYLLFFYRKGPLYKCFFPVVVFFPHIWTMMFLIGRTIIYQINRKVEYNKDELILPGYNGKSLVELDKEKETNIVPVEEALLMNEYDVKRRMVIEVAKRDPAGYLEKLKLALLSEDTETAHYAASSISHLKRTNDKRLREAKENYEKLRNIYEIRVEYIDALKMVIESKLSIDAIISEYVDDLISVLEKHIQVGELINPETFDSLLDNLIRQDRLDEAIKWTDEYESLYPDNEKPMVYELKISYLKKDRFAFDESMDRIMNAGFTLSQETVDMINFWKGK